MKDEVNTQLDILVTRCNSFLKQTETVDGRFLATPVDRQTAESTNSILSMLKNLLPDDAKSLPASITTGSTWMTARIRIQEVVDCVHVIRKRE